MKTQRRLTAILIFLSILFSGVVEAKKRKPWQDPVETVSLGWTHQLPSAYVIPHLHLVLGSTVGIGLFDVAELTSNLYLDVQQVFNISSKFSLWATQEFAFALFVGYVSQQVRVNTLNTTTNRYEEKFSNMTSVTPGAVASYLILPKISGHVGAQMAFLSPEIKKSDLAKRTSFVRGHTLFKEFTYGFKKDMAVSTGGSYDLTYDVWGAGVSMHIGSFQIGGHYYFNVVEGPFQPIIAGSYSADL